MKDKVFSNKSTLNIGGNLLDITSPKVMGIINVTPDSFYAGSRKQAISEIVKTAGNMIRDGATFLDIGGYSSKPDAEDISIQKELERVLPPIEAIAEKYPEAIISIDTFRSEVAAKALESGASLVNDISAGNLDPEIVDVVASKGAPYIIMHMRGTPQTMQTLTNYDDVVLEVFDFLRKKTSKLQERGIADIIIDPGFGFSKTIEQNYVLLRNLAYFNALELPILVGISRKSMIFKKLGIRAEDALNGTTVLNTIALTHGAGILRVHDVKEAVEVVKLFEIINC